MPELPEVEACRRSWEAWLHDREVVFADAPDPAAIRPTLSTRPSEALAGGAERWGQTRGPLRHTQREAKRLGVVIGDTAWKLHLGMTGRWVKRGAEAPGPHVRLRLRLDNESWLWFEDSRRFGCVAPVEMGRLDEELRLGLGPDAWKLPLSREQWGERLRGRRPIKVALLDQEVVGGIGNIHAVEVLWRAGIHPEQPCGSLHPRQHAALAHAIHLQLSAAIEEIDIGEYVYVNQGGENTFSVYGREGEPCGRCGTEIEQVKLGGRSTAFCPACQQMVK